MTDPCASLSAVRVALGGPGRGLLLELIHSRQRAVAVPFKAEELPVPALDLRRRVLQPRYQVSPRVEGALELAADGAVVPGVRLQLVLGSVGGDVALLRQRRERSECGLQLFAEGNADPFLFSQVLLKLGLQSDRGGSEFLAVLLVHLHKNRFLFLYHCLKVLSGRNVRLPLLIQLAVLALVAYPAVSAHAATSSSCQLAIQS